MPHGIRNIKDICRTIIQTGDGLCAIGWSTVFIVFAIFSIEKDGPTYQQFRYIFFSLISFLIFLRFRVSDFKSASNTNTWGVININIFGFFIIFMEFFK